MKSLLIAALIAGSALTPAAHADSGFGWEGGGCHWSALDDTSPGGVLGGQDTWHGYVSLLVIPNDAETGLPSGAAVTAECVLMIDGANERTVLAGSGVGVAAAAGTLTFTADYPDVVVQLCTRVTVGTETIDDCGDGDPCPGALCTLAFVGSKVNEVFAQAVDPVLCPQLVALAPTVDGLPTANVLYIDPATGDTYAGGTTQDDLVYDCPPYII
jgi:hypothetical protein